MSSTKIPVKFTQTARNVKNQSSNKLIYCSKDNETISATAIYYLQVLFIQIFLWLFLLNAKCGRLKVTLLVWKGYFVLVFCSGRSLTCYQLFVYYYYSHNIFCTTQDIFNTILKVISSEREDMTVEIACLSETKCHSLNFIKVIIAWRIASTKL